MKLIGMWSLAGLLAAALAVTGCAGTPSTPKSAAAQRTPSWMKHQVVGSRIPRRVDSKGRPVSSDNVVTTTDEGLADLPSITRNISRGPSLH